MLRLLSALRVQSWPLLRVVAVNEPLLPLAAMKSNMEGKFYKGLLAVSCEQKGSSPAASTNGAAAAGCQSVKDCSDKCVPVSHPSREDPGAPATTVHVFSLVRARC